MNRHLRIGMCATLLFACSGEGEQLPSVIERTENGVRIVENTTLLADSIAWTFDSIPTVTIGVAEGEPEYIIGRLGGYLRRTDGSFLLGDAIAQTIRHYDSAGVFIATFGGNGDGPGEYRVLRAIGTHLGDSVFVVDYEGSRGTALRPDLTYVRSFQIRLDSTQARSGSKSDGVADVAGDGHLLMYDYMNTCGPRGYEGFCEDSMALYRTDLTGTSVSSMGRFVYMRSEYRKARPGSYVAWGEPHPQVFRRTRGVKTYFADAKRFEIQVLGPNGRLEMIVRAPQLRHEYSRSHLFGERTPRPDADSSERGMQRLLTETQRSTEIPDSLPQFSAFLVDDEGSMWLGEYRAPGVKHVGWPRWYVFSSEGHLTNIVRAPQEFRIHNAPWLQSYPQIGKDVGITSRRDADGVESVVTYTLRKR